MVYIFRCAGETYSRIGSSWYPCRNNGTIEEAGKWWCKIHAPSLVLKRREERNDRLRAADALVARQRRMAQRAEAVRIVQAWNDFLDGGGRQSWRLTPAEFAAYLYPEPSPGPRTNEWGERTDGPLQPGETFTVIPEPKEAE